MYKIINTDYDNHLMYNVVRYFLFNVFNYAINGYLCYCWLAEQNNNIIGGMLTMWEVLEGIKSIFIFEGNRSIIVTAWGTAIAHVQVSLSTKARSLSLSPLSLSLYNYEAWFKTGIPRCWACTLVYIVYTKNA